MITLLDFQKLRPSTVEVYNGLERALIKRNKKVTYYKLVLDEDRHPLGFEEDKNPSEKIKNSVSEIFKNFKKYKQFF